MPVGVDGGPGRTPLARRLELLAGERRALGRLALGGSLAAALIAGTWVVARWSLHDRLAALEQEVAFHRSTRNIDIPELLGEFRTFVGSANAKLELEKLTKEHRRTLAELERANAMLAELRRTSRLEERFSLEVGQSRTILNGKVDVGLLSVAPTYADVSFAGSPENGWRVGEYRELNFGGTRYRLVLERIPAGDQGRVTFRVDALPPAPEPAAAPSAGSATPPN
jgi:hypothetical protein